MAAVLSAPVKEALRPFALALVALLLLTALSYGLSLLSLGGFGTVIALTVAGVKVLVVAMVFMELRHAGPINWIIALITILFVTILCLGLLSDVLYR